MTYAEQVAARRSRLLARIGPALEAREAERQAKREAEAERLKVKRGISKIDYMREWHRRHPDYPKIWLASQALCDGCGRVTCRPLAADCPRRRMRREYLRRP